MDPPEPSVKRLFCAIIGAGMCGVSLGHNLVRTNTLKHEEFVILDKNCDFGGVWESNKYPGAACDIPSHAYVMRCFLNPEWTQKFAVGKEIQQYYSKFADHYGLRKNTIFNTYVHEARWNEKTNLWEVLTEDRRSGLRTLYIVNVLFDNGGGFHRPKYANIPGREKFKGKQWHTAEWPEDADIAGKRVAVIGTGPSAAQVGPKIQPVVGKLYMFQRSCGHVLPRNNQLIPEWKKACFRWLYPILWMYHLSWYIFFEGSKPMWMSGTKKNQEMHDICISFLDREVKDPVIKEKLRPKNEFGCKRVLFLDDWYSMYNQQNVELVTDKPIRITERGIVCRSPGTSQEERTKESTKSHLVTGNDVLDEGEVEKEIDVLIWGTGFDMNDSGGHFQIYGINGANLSQTWKDYPKTYWSVAVTGFPNLFLTLGPNSTNYWSNITTVVEIQINYHCKMVRKIKKLSQQKPYAVYPDPVVTNNFNEWLEENRGTPSFLAPHCATYHKTPAGATPMYNHYHVWNYYWKMLWPTLGEFVHIH